MRARLKILLLGFVYFSQALQSQTPYRKGDSFVWEELHLSLPEAIVAVPSKIPREKKLKIYPTQGDSFFIVIRTWENTWELDPEKEWIQSGFWKQTNPLKKDIQKEGRNIQVYAADQIRNYNSLRSFVWFWKEDEKTYWIWITCKQERLDLVDIFSQGEFFSFEKK